MSEDIEKNGKFKFLRLSTTFAILAVVVVLVAVGWALKEQNSRSETAKELALVTQQNIELSCEAGNSTRAAINDVFNFIRLTIESAPDYNPTPEEKLQSDAFWEGVSSRLQPRAC